MKVKCTITYEWEEEVDLDEYRDFDEDIETAMERYEDHVFIDRYTALNGRADNLLPVNWHSQCVIELEDGARSCMMTG